MHLYHLQLHRPDAVTAAVVGSFSAPKIQEIVVARGFVLEVYKVDQSGHLAPVISTNVFGVIRSLSVFRLHGSQRDYLCIGSDSGRISIAQIEKGQFKRVHLETFGRTGCRRVVPGQYMACDPNGRAVMIAAVEKQKFVYILNRDTDNNLTISSPLEAHKSHSIIYSICGIDVGHDNPVFAALEVDYSELDENHEAPEPDRQLVYYELDLGLNHVLRKWNKPVADTAHLLIPVPGGSDGPSGVLVCSENYITYKHSTQSDKVEIRASIPRRQDVSVEHGLIIVSHCTHLLRDKSIKMVDRLFILVQSEYGDLYRVKLDFREESEGVFVVRGISVRYFDTIVVCSAMCILRAGFIFAAAEFGNHKLYQIKNLGEKEGDDEGILGWITVGEGDNEEETKETFALLKPNPLKHLIPFDDINSLCPLIETKVANLAPMEDSPQLYCLCGRGPQSTLRVLRHGLAVQELAQAELPGTPTFIWTVRKSYKSPLDDYIVVTFTNATLVLKVGENVEEAQDTGFHNQTSTIHCCTLSDDSIVQIHPNGIRHIQRDSRVTEWKSSVRITKASNNATQLLIARGTELLLFELQTTGGLNHVLEANLGSDITAMDVAPVQEGRQRARFGAVALADSSVRVYSFDADLSAPIARLICQNSSPVSVALTLMPSESSDGGDKLYLFVGLDNGQLQRCTVDMGTGQLRDARQRLCGVNRCKLVKVVTQGVSSVLVLSTQTWLCYSANNRFRITPFGQNCVAEHASPFASDSCPEGLVTIQGNKVRILALEHVGDSIFSQTIIKLKCTPRHFVIHPDTNYLVLLETDHRAYTNEKKKMERRKLRQSLLEEPEDEEEAEEKDRAEERDLPEREYGAIKAPEGTWASYIRIFDPITQKTQDHIELEENQAAISLCLADLVDSTGSKQKCLVVGTVQNMIPNPRSAKSGALLVFKFTSYNRQLELVHKTTVEGIPQALCAFEGQLLAGIGNILRLYSLGKHKLLKKAENRSFPSSITQISSIADRIYVADTTESVMFVKYRRSEKEGPRLNIFADSATPRWVTSTCTLDYHTTAIGDKFGNFTVLRLTKGANEDAEDPSSMRADRHLPVIGAATKGEEIVQFHVGDIITTVQKCSLTPDQSSKIILYTTLLGSIGAFIPMQARDDADFFLRLELLIRQEHNSLIGRDQNSYRGYYFPVKNVIDGDYCELYTMLPYAKQEEIAKEFDRSPEELCKRLEEMRNLIL